MPTDSLARRRHAIAAPAICHKPPYPGTPPVPYGTCVCYVGTNWDPVLKILHSGFDAARSTLPPNDPLLAWVHSIPELTWTNPYNAGNDLAYALPDQTIPPGTTGVTITIGFQFSDGHWCTAHAYQATPGA